MDHGASGSIAKNAKIAKDRRKLNALCKLLFQFGVFSNSGYFGKADNR
jgi:hypothetical protein